MAIPQFCPGHLKKKRCSGIDRPEARARQATAVFIVPFGRIADIHGRKKIFLLGITAFTISTVLCVIGIFASLARGRIRGRGE